jgi:hypothetical protein
VTGWRSGTVLAAAPGSDWEGGRRLLIQPCHDKQHARGEAGGDEPPVWLPMVCRGRATSPFLAPPLLVRPRYVPDSTLVLPGAAEAAAKKGEQQEELVVGSIIEVLRGGAWMPSEVTSLPSNAPAAAAAGGGSSGSDSIGLHNLDAPEGDAIVWRCSASHPMRWVGGWFGGRRCDASSCTHLTQLSDILGTVSSLLPACRPLHPQYMRGCGVLLTEVLDEPHTTAQLRKQLAAYMYAGNGIHAFACLDQMRAAYATEQTA